MKVTILQCVYNGDNPDHLIQAMNSVVANLSFNKVNWLIIVDGPINHNLRRVIDRFRNNSNLKIHFNEINLGLAEALNIGLNMIETDWILRFDSDDLMEPTWIDEILKFVEDEPDEFLISFNVEEFSETKCDINQTKSVPKNVTPYIFFRNPVNHMSVLFKVKEAKALGGYPNLNGFEDYGLWWLAYVQGLKMRFINERFVHARVGNGFHSRRSGLNYLFRNINFESFRLKSCRSNVQRLCLIFSASIRLLALVGNNIFNGKITQKLRS